TAATVGQLAIDPVTPSTIYGITGFLGLFTSIDGNGSWNRAANVGLPLTVHLNGLAVDTSNPATLYTTAEKRGEYKTTNAGGTWSLIKNGLTNLEVGSIALDPVHPTVLYVGSSTGLFKTSDAGGSWMAMGLTGEHVESITVDPANPNVVYAG